MYCVIIITYCVTLKYQGKTFAVSEFFLEDVLEKTRYNIKSEFENFEGNSRRRRQQESKKDPLSELFEVFFLSLILYLMFNCFFLYWHG